MFPGGFSRGVALSSNLALRGCRSFFRPAVVNLNQGDREFAARYVIFIYRYLNAIQLPVTFAGIMDGIGEQLTREPYDR